MLKARNFPATKALCLGMLLASVVAAYTERLWGLGFSHLVYNLESLKHGELWRLVTYVWVIADPAALFFTLLVFWWLGKICESRFGSKKFLLIFGGSALLSAILAFPLNYGFNFLHLFKDTTLSSGPKTVFNALLVIWWLLEPEAQVLLGFVLPFKIKTFIAGLLSFEVISGLMLGRAELSMQLAGMLSGYLLSRLWLLRGRGANKWRH